MRGKPTHSHVGKGSGTLWLKIVGVLSSGQLEKASWRKPVGRRDWVNIWRRKRGQTRWEMLVLEQKLRNTQAKLGFGVFKKTALYKMYKL